MTTEKNESPHLDAELAARVMGKHVLIGLTYLGSTGDVTEQKQLHGIVEQASAGSGVVIRQPDGSLFRLPPDLRGIREAPPGTYRLHATGEAVENPDYLWTWTITSPSP